MTPDQSTAPSPDPITGPVEKPTHDEEPNTVGSSPSVKLAVNQGLKSYIERLRGVLEQGESNYELASQSLSEAVTANLEASLSAQEILELRDILQSAERKIAGERAAGGGGSSEM